MFRLPSELQGKFNLHMEVQLHTLLTDTILPRPKTCFFTKTSQKVQLFLKKRMPLFGVRKL